MNTLHKKGFTALMIAVKRNHAKCVEQLLKSKSIDVDKGDFWNKNTALICAAYKGYESCLELLLHAGANVNRPNAEKFTPLIYANINGHHKCVELLLQAGAVVNIPDAKGLTALMHASVNGYCQCVELLLNVGAVVNLIDETEDTALMLAS